jgi:hypothetical protein
LELLREGRGTARNPIGIHRGGRIMPNQGPSSIHYAIIMLCPSLGCYSSERKTKGESTEKERSIKVQDVQSSLLHYCVRDTKEHARPHPRR